MTLRIHEQRLTLFTLACLGLARSSPAAAAEPVPEPAVIGFDAALDAARQGNLDLDVARVRLRQADAAVAQARAAFLPTANASATYTHNYAEVTLDVPTSATTTESITVLKGDAVSAALSVNVPLVAPAGWVGLQAAKASRDAQGESLASTEADILLGVAVAFYADAGAVQLVTARHEGVALARTELDRASARLKAGAGTQLEVTRASLALVRASEAEVQSIAVQGRADRALGLLLGLDGPVRAQVSPDRMPSNASTASNPAESAGLAITALSHPVLGPKAVEDALATRPDAASLVDAARAATLRARAASWRWAPTLSAFGNVVGQNYSGFSGDPYSWAAGAQLGWQLYDGGLRDAARASALADAAEANARSEQLRAKVDVQIRDAESDWDTALLATVSADQEVGLAQETLRLVELQANAGVATQVDRLAAADALTQARVANVNASFNADVAHIQLDKARGLFPAATLEKPASGASSP